MAEQEMVIKSEEIEVKHENTNEEQPYENLNHDDHENNIPKSEIDESLPPVYFCSLEYKSETKQQNLKMVEHAKHYKRLQPIRPLIKNDDSKILGAKIKSEKFRFLPKKVTGRGKTACSQCKKIYNNRSIPHTCECGYILGGKFVSKSYKVVKCPECEYQICQRNATNVMKKHVDAIHAGVTYNCDFCEFKSGYKQVLKKHIESLHQGVKYSCKECDYTNKFESGLYQHVQAVHRGVRYMCQFCGYQALATSALRKHEKVQHKEELEKLGDDENSRSRARFQVKNFPKQ